MNASGEKSIVLLFALCAFLGFGAVGLAALRKANEAADHSAHAAISTEICELLAAVPHGQPYPASLSELRLTFPDGGDAALMKRFTYYSTGTNCTLQTRLGGEEILRSFP
jgi:hypothetical protein